MMKMKLLAPSRFAMAPDMVSRAVVFLGLISLTAVGCGQPRGPMAIDPDAPTKFTETKSGLKYRILRKGSGERPRENDFVKVDYSGWLDNDKIFDSSYDRAQPVSFNLKRVVPGWTEGLQLVREGGMIELEIPPELGYGAAEKPGIPANSTLHFKVELLEIQ